MRQVGKRSGPLDEVALGDDDDVILTYSAQMKDGVKVDAKQVKE